MPPNDQHKVTTDWSHSLVTASCEQSPCWCAAWLLSKTNGICLLMEDSRVYFCYHSSLGFVGQKGSVKPSHFQSCSPFPSIYNKNSLPVPKLHITISRFQTSVLEWRELLKIDFFFPPSLSILISLCRGASPNPTPKRYLQHVSWWIVSALPGYLQWLFCN